MNPIEVVKDIVTTSAAGIAGYVAISGLSAWKKQLKGKTDYELARRYLKAAYKLRDAFQEVRNPWISSEEMIAALKERGHNEEDINDRKKTDWAVYGLRWNKVVTATTDLHVELTEAEVSWGREAVTVQEDLDGCSRKLYTSIRMHLEGHKITEDRDIIYNAGAEDVFSKEVDKAITKIENYLKPHLK